MIDGLLLFNENAAMKSPFRKGRRVCIANDMVLVAGRVTDPEFDLGRGHWGVLIMVPPQPGLEELLRDTGHYQCEVDVTHSKGVFKGYTGPSLSFEADGVVPQ